MFRFCFALFLTIPIAILISAHDDEEDFMEHLKYMNLTNVIDSCNSTFTIDNEYLTSLSESGSFPDETNEDAKCFIKCFIESLGIMNAKGKFNTTNAAYFLEVIDEMGNNTMALKIVNRCITNRVESCLCDKSYAFVRCTMERLIELHDD